MATIHETKQALELEREKALELAEQSLQSIQTITDVGNLYLTIIGIGIGLVALVGVAAVYIGSKREAKRVADGRIDAYIKSEEGQALIQKVIASEVNSKIAERVSVMVRPPPPPQGEGEGFPEKPTKRSSNGGKGGTA